MPHMVGQKGVLNIGYSKALMAFTTVLEALLVLARFACLSESWLLIQYCSV
jgi:hypothetical protein